MIKALIFLPAVSKTVAQVRIPLGRFFRRCPEHDNLLCLDGRALDMAEFNAIAPKMINQLIITQIGSLPCVKLVEVADAAAPALDAVPPPSVPVTDVTPPAAVAPPVEVPAVPEATLPVDVVVETVEGGFVLADYRAEAAFQGEGDAGWQGDISLVAPFATAEAATAAFGTSPAPESDPAPSAPKRSHKKK